MCSNGVNVGGPAAFPRPALVVREVKDYQATLRRADGIRHRSAPHVYYSRRATQCRILDTIEVAAGPPLSRSRTAFPNPPLIHDHYARSGRLDQPLANLSCRRPDGNGGVAPGATGSGLSGLSIGPPAPHAVLRWPTLRISPNNEIKAGLNAGMSLGWRLLTQFRSRTTSRLSQ